MTYNEIYNKVMPLQKRQEEKWNIWVVWVVRPLSVLLTQPLLHTDIKPLTITAISIVCSLIGCWLLAFGMSLGLRILGWFFFFSWAVLDGVDGNLARCTNKCSQLGDLWDTTGGYTAMILMYFSAGIAAFFDVNVFAFLPSYICLILGGATALCSIFPRLVMHKKKSQGQKSSTVEALSDKRSFGIVQIIAVNLVSPSGFMQVILLGSIVLNLLNVWISVYFVINLVIMLVSLYKLLRA